MAESKLTHDLAELAEQCLDPFKPQTEPDLRLFKLELFEDIPADDSKDVEGLGGISLRLVGSEDVDLAGTSFSLAINDDSNVTVSIANEQNNHMTSAAGLKRRAHHSLDDDIFKKDQFEKKQKI
jgi:hypothetical protein